MSAESPSPQRVVLGGFLMGLANLVPGVSGGTMILAVGLYDRFIEAVARVTSLRWSKDVLLFMALVVAGAFVAILGLSAPAVWLVVEHRWIAYSLFVGMTLGGVPLLWRVVQPLSMSSIVSFAVFLAAMVWVARGLSDSPLQQNFGSFVLVGAIAASSMILPGISGSYVLLIFGMYDVVVGSLRPRELLDDLSGSIGILVPIALGVALGIGVLSNVLKVVLAKFEKPAHAALMGLLLGSVAGLYPFQEAVHEDLASKDHVDSVLMVLEGAPADAIEDDTGIDLEPEDRARITSTYGGLSKGELKLLGLQLEVYDPTALQLGGMVVLLVGGFLITRQLGRS